MASSSALDAAKDAAQTAENLIHRRTSECYERGQHPTLTPLTIRDGMILVDALVKVMEAIEVVAADA